MATQIRRRRRRNLPGDVEDDIRRLALAGWSAKQVHEQVAHDDIPSLRTVQRMVAEMTPAAPDAPWSFHDAATDEIGVVMSVLREEIDGAHRLVDGMPRVSKAEAAWLVRLRSAAPDVPASAALTLAQLLVLASNPKPPLFVGDDWPESVNCFLAFAPWRNAAARAPYERAAKSGGLPCSQWMSLTRRKTIKFIAPTKPQYGKRSGPQKTVIDSD